MNRRISKRSVFFAAMAGTTLLLSACGSSSDTRTAATIQPPAINGMSSNGTPVSDINQVSPQAMQSMFGTYDGMIYKVSSTDSSRVDSQPYSFGFSSRAYNGVNYGYLQFSSSGPVGNINFDAYMGVSLNGLSGSYSFVSGLGSIPELSPYPVKIELILTVYNGIVFPAQSKISIKDCVFSEVVCTNSLQNVWFGDRFVKR